MSGKVPRKNGSIDFMPIKILKITIIRNMLLYAAGPRMLAMDFNGKFSVLEIKIKSGSAKKLR